MIPIMAWMIRPALHVALFWLAVICCFSPAWADTVDVNGVKRSYIAQLPAKKPAPLVIVLHGKTQRGADMVARTAWPQLARREGLAVVFPDGLNHAWADARTKAGPALRGPPVGTDDIAFITKLVEKLVANGTADPRRLYVAGISNGGAMAMTLACARADLFAAAASVIMNLTDEAAATCHPSRPLPMLLMNGTADPLVPYEGGQGSSYFAADGFWSTEDTLAFWRRLNGCEIDDAEVADLPDKAPTDQSTVTRISSRCPGGTRCRARSHQLWRPPHAGLRAGCSLPECRNASAGTAEQRYRWGRDDLDVFQPVSVDASACAADNACVAGNACVPGVARRKSLG